MRVEIEKNRANAMMGLGVLLVAALPIWSGRMIASSAKTGFGSY